MRRNNTKSSSIKRLVDNYRYELYKTLPEKIKESLTCDQSVELLNFMYEKVKHSIKKEKCCDACDTVFESLRGENYCCHSCKMILVLHEKHKT